MLIGVFPWFFEELGWMGYAFPQILKGSKNSRLLVSIFLGVLWGLWHIPVVDNLGAAVPMGDIGCLFLRSSLQCES